MDECLSSEAWERFTASGQVYMHPCRLFDISLTVSVAGASVLVYDGQDATTGLLRITLEAAANRSTMFNSIKGIPFYKGIFVTVNVNVDEVCFGYCPVKHD
jgi:hypothetical protein